MRNKGIIFGCLIISISLIICSYMLQDSNLLRNGVHTEGSSFSVPSNLNFNQNDVMQIDDVCTYLGIDATALKDAIEKNELPGLPYIKLGDNYLFSRKQIDIWVQEAAKNKQNFKISFKPQ